MDADHGVKHHWPHSRRKVPEWRYIVKEILSGIRSLFEISRVAEKNVGKKAGSKNDDAKSSRCTILLNADFASVQTGHCFAVHLDETVTCLAPSF